MTGAEHYEEAEFLLEAVAQFAVDTDVRPGGMLAAAQVHATLALAAAQVDHARVQAGMLAGVLVDGYGR